MLLRKYPASRTPDVEDSATCLGMYGVAYLAIMKPQLIAAKIEGRNIALIDTNGFRAAYAGSPGLAWDECFTNVVVNGNFLVATTSKNTVITWDISTGSPSVVSRR